MWPEPSAAEADLETLAIEGGEGSIFMVDVEGEDEKVVNITRYLFPPEDCKFDVSDMVWGKIRSHPWWPAQIFDPADASDEALKHKKKDGVLVAYFGDHTYAWNEKSSLRPFRSHFSKMSKQSSMTSFVNAVNCSVDEVSRRVEFGLACFCIPCEVYGRIKSQRIENAGIREGASLADGAYGSYNMTSFEPSKLVQYLEELARSPLGGYDKLDLTIAKAQLLSFYRTKGYLELPDFSIGLAWPDFETELARTEAAVADVNVKTPEVKKLKNKSASSGKRSFSEDRFGKSKKQRSLADLMEYKNSDSTNGKDQDKVDSLSRDSAQSKKRKISPKNVDKADSLANNKSFKVGECISKVASKLTRSLMTCKSSDRTVKKSSEVEENEQDDVPSDISPRTRGEYMRKAGSLVEYSSTDDMLSQLCLAARNPLTLLSFVPMVTAFFSDYRNNSLSTEGNMKIDTCESSVKLAQSESDLDDSVKVEDVEDLGIGENLEHVTEEAEKMLESDALSVMKDDDQLTHANVAEVSVNEGVDQECSPTALILNFSEVDSLPSQADLVKIFGQYGPLVEAETVIMRKTKRAKVVFEKKAHAEVAFSSAGKFHIFGPALVSYRLRYLPSPSKAAVGCTERDKRRERNEGGGNPVAVLSDDLNIQMDGVAHDNEISSPLTENGVEQRDCPTELLNQDTNLISQPPGSQMHLESGAERPSALPDATDRHLERTGGNLPADTGDASNPPPQTPGPITEIPVQDSGKAHFAQGVLSSS